jgi:hypothetical protein
MAWLVTAIGILWWMLCGAAITLAVMVWHGKRTYERQELFAPYAVLLGKACWIEDKFTGRREKFRIVAVSHKGAINVRRWDNDSGKGAFWVPANKVKERVRFEGVEK